MSPKAKSGLARAGPGTIRKAERVHRRELGRSVDSRKKKMEFRQLLPQNHAHSPKNGASVGGEHWPRLRGVEKLAPVACVRVVDGTL
jgi:hypothetical protein